MFGWCSFWTFSVVGIVVLFKAGVVGEGTGTGVHKKERTKAGEKPEGKTESMKERKKERKKERRKRTSNASEK